jgi:organic hydroperoxide reductase OsmC/OhrA
MRIVKDFRFPVSVRLDERRRTVASAPDKPTLDVASPPEFHGGVRGVWSPEELIVASAASCYALTFAAVAERRAIPVRNVVVSGAGHVTRRDDGRFGFIAIELDLTVETDQVHHEAAGIIARKAKEICIVTMALEVPVDLRMDIRTGALEEVA